MTERYNRHYPFFGKKGQTKLRSMTVAVVGVGGTGSHVVQQLAYLGVGGLVLIDDEELDETNLNRHVAARADDPIPGSLKVGLGKRLIHQIDPEIDVLTIPDSLISEVGFSAVVEADAVFGCVDNDGVRFVLNELCCAYEKPYFDVASGIMPDGVYGGKVCSVVNGEGCLFCHDQLDREEIDAYLSTTEQKEARRGAYDVPPEELANGGPSVVSINGVVASLGATEFMLWATGIRAPVRIMFYRGNLGIVNRPVDPPWEDCYYCNAVRGRRAAADVQRYIK